MDTERQVNVLFLVVQVYSQDVVSCIIAKGVHVQGFYI